MSADCSHLVFAAAAAAVRMRFAAGGAVVQRSEVAGDVVESTDGLFAARGTERQTRTRKCSNQDTEFESKIVVIHMYIYRQRTTLNSFWLMTEFGNYCPDITT